MFRVFLIAVLGVVCLGTSANADDRSLMEALARYEGPNGLDLESIRKDYEQQRRARVVTAVSRVEPNAAKQEPTGTAEPLLPPRRVEDVKLFLRKDFADIVLFQDPASAFQAEGASFSWAKDGIADDTAWTADGMVAVAYTYEGDYRKPGELFGLLGVALAPFVQVEREEHSKTRAKDRDVLAYGGSLELGLDFGEAGSHYLRYSGRDVRDDIDDEHKYSSTVEWFPVHRQSCLGYPCPLLPRSMVGPGPQWIFRFSPEIKVQHEVAFDDQKLFFSGGTNSLRIGPEAILKVRPFSAKPPAGLLDVARLSASATYHWSYETYSQRDFEWLSAALIYNFDEAGHFGLKASYNKGNNELTGIETDLFKVTLSGKY